MKQVTIKELEAMVLQEENDSFWAEDTTETDWWVSLQELLSVVEPGYTIYNRRLRQVSPEVLQEELGDAIKDIFAELYAHACSPYCMSEEVAVQLTEFSLLLADDMQLATTRLGSHTEAYLVISE